MPFKCGICLSNIKCLKKLICNHMFCKNCVNIWLNNHNTCPICRAVVKDFTRKLNNNVIREYHSYDIYSIYVIFNGILNVILIVIALMLYNDEF